MAGDVLRVVIDGSALPARPAGAGVYTIELARALTKREDVAITLAAPVAVDGVRTVRSPAGGALRRNAWEQRDLPRLLRNEGIDIVHGAHFAIPLSASVPRVATVHDLTFHRLPKRYSLARRWYYRALARLATRAERLIVPSRAVAGDVLRYLNYPPERIRVVAEAARAGLAPASESAVEELCERLQIERPYLLCLGTAEPGKRAIDAIRALAILRERGEHAHLVLAGNAGALSEPLKRAAQELGVGDQVLFAGYVNDEDLAALYSGATALVFPSLYEGFGLPPLEAMACGTPVIASRAPAMNDVFDAAAMFVSVGVPEEIARYAGRLLADRDVRAEWAAKGLTHAARFSWERAAAETVAVYRELVP
jgi:glycosyltransferase involved in cell wall biosynthesis